MYQIIKEIDFCYAHRLMDFDGPCRYLHGHNGRVEIVLQREFLDDNDMVYEFSELKRRMKAWIDENLDHRTLLRQDDPLRDALDEHGQPFYMMKRNPTAEAIAAEIFRQTQEMGFPVLEVRLWETATSCASYRGVETR